MRIVLTCRADGTKAPAGHDVAGRHEFARRLARIMGATFGGEFDPRVDYGGRPYWVPDDALPIERARALGVQTHDDLFGGVVPHPFVATKAISHGLPHAAARAPAGWCPAFARRIEPVVLRGFTAFDVADALRAAQALLDVGPVRIKPCAGIGGSGQTVASTAIEAARAVAALGSDELASSGVVVEENLDRATTYSVGQVVACGTTMSYCGTQRTVRNSRGQEVYGGSTIDCVRGGFDALLREARDTAARRAAAAARSYDEAATRSFEGFFASRRNYDVVSGVDARGHERVGVLEQSWRMGGASGAELLALEAFRQEASLARVRASTVEIYDSAHAAPGGAFVYYRGSDAGNAPLAKYAMLEADAHA